MRKKIIIIGAGLAGLECGKTLLSNGFRDFLILDRKKELPEAKSWKTFPEVVSDFNLDDCCYGELNEVHFRSINLDELTVLQDNTKTIPSKVLHSEKVYEKYQSLLHPFIRTNQNVARITRSYGLYRIETPDHLYYAEKIIDASGWKAVTDSIRDQGSFKQNAFYTCYARRFSNCDTTMIQNSFYFDFDHPSYLCGSWIYKLDDSHAEIGVARLVGHDELSNPEDLKAVHALFDQYIKMEPFNTIFRNAHYEKTILGNSPLKPRLDIQKNDIYYVGDAKGTVPYSGYGIQNALESGRAAALSIIHRKKYDYFITPPALGFCLLKILWNTGMSLRILANGISYLDAANTKKFFTGKIDFPFFKISVQILIKLGFKLSDFLSWQDRFRLFMGLSLSKESYNLTRK